MREVASLILHRDYETRSACDLKKCGAHRYAQDKTTRVLVAVFIVEWPDGRLEVIIWHPGQPVPEIVKRAAREGWTFGGHNAAFEQAIDREIMGPRHGFPIIPNEQVDCTMARAAIMGLPLDLARGCKALKVKYQKDDVGHKLMLKMCKPRKLRKGEVATPDEYGLYWYESPAEIERLTQYCVSDVYAEIALGDAMPPMPPAEKEVWLLDQRMNNRGVRIDLPFIDAARHVADETMTRLNGLITEASGGYVTAATQVDRIKDFCKLYGVELKEVTKKRRNGEEYKTEAADKEAIQDLLDTDLPASVRRVLELRLEAGKSSVNKLEKFKAQTCFDGRARGNLQYHAAQPGRWAGRGIQMQNLRRDGLMPPNPEKGLPGDGTHEDVQKALRELDNEELELVYGSPLDLLSRMLRGSIIAEPDNRLIFGDYSNVEGRGCAWVSGHTDKIELFRNNGRIYETAGASIFNISIEEVIAGHKSGLNPMPRFIGKETELGCGYGMGPPAFIRNVKKKTRIILPPELAQQGVYGWREANAPIVDFWHELEDAARGAIENPGQVFTAGPFAYRMRGRWLQCRLPSGRIIWYCNAHLAPKSADVEQLDEGEEVPRYRWAIHYWTLNGITKQWEKTSTWGGKLLQNAIEGLCRDFLAGALLRLDAVGYEPILSVHDEAIAEVPDGFGSIKEFDTIMTELPVWGFGFPLKADVKEGKRYAKS